MHRSVLENREFIRWANEAVVAFVAHNEMGHEESEEPGPYDRPVRRCRLYPGLSCRDHVDAAVDVDNARGEDLVKVPFLELCPNTWLVSPTGEVARVEEKDQFVPAAIREQAEVLQKSLGRRHAPGAFPPLADLLAKADDAVDGERFHEALTTLAALGRQGLPHGATEPHEALRALIEARLDAVEEDALWLFEEARDDAKASPDARRERIERVAAATDVPVLGKRIPTHAAAQAWLTSPR